MIDKIYVLSLSASKEQPKPIFRLTEEEVKDTAKAFTLLNTPADPCANKRYAKENEYQVIRNGAMGFISFGRDKARLLEEYIKIVVPEEVKDILKPDIISDIAKMSTLEESMAHEIKPFDESAFVQKSNEPVPQDNPDEESYLTNPFAPNSVDPLFDPFAWDDDDMPQLSITGLQERPVSDKSLDISVSEKVPFADTKPGSSGNPLLDYIRAEVPVRLMDLFGIDPSEEHELVELCISALSGEPDSVINFDVIDQKLEELIIEHQIDDYSGDGSEYCSAVEDEFEFPKRGNVTVYTDGSCIGNPGAGGWGVVIRGGGKKKEISGGEAETTNNRMELLGPIEALKFLTPEHNVTLYSDSQYVVNGIIKGWAASWRKNGWVKGDGEPAKNADLWAELLTLVETRNVQLRWVKGHAGNPDNERCDQLASAQSAKYDALNYNRHYN